MAKTFKGFIAGLTLTCISFCGLWYSFRKAIELMVKPFEFTPILLNGVIMILSAIAFVCFTFYTISEV